jgi:sugar lactone lactonase YvrE
VRKAAAGFLAVTALLGPASVPAAGAAERERWDTRVLAKVPSPGFPARAYVHPNGRVYEGTYVNPAGDKLQSKVFEFDGEGALLRSWNVPGQDLSAAHGVQVATSDARGRLVLLDRTPSRALVLDPDTAEITTYARFPDLAPCGDGGTEGHCSPTRGNEPPFANYAAWGPDGSLYVTDYAQAVIWRVPPGGGEPTPWLADPRLDGQAFGTAGIVLAQDGRTLLFTQGSSLGMAAGNPFTGRLYAVPIEPDGRPGPVRQIWESAFGDLPDGFAVARSGNVYIALVGLPAQLVVVAPDGRELERFPPVPLTGDNGSEVPFDSPSSAWFLGTRLIVANQSAVAGDPEHQVLLDVETGEPGAPELIPANAGPVFAQAAREPDLTGRVRRSRGREVVVVLSRAPVAGSRGIRVRVTARGRTVATGTLRRRTLRLVLRRGARLPDRFTLRPLGRSRFESRAVTIG